MSAADRPLGPLLLIGMLAVPAVLVWGFLRAGYGPSLRRTACWYAGTMTIIPIIGRLGSV